MHALTHIPAGGLPWSKMEENDRPRIVIGSTSIRFPLMHTGTMSSIELSEAINLVGDPPGA